MQKKKIKKTKIFKINELTIPKNYSLMTIGISQTLLSRYKKCKRSFLYSINRYTTTESVKNTFYGNLCHHITAKAYKTSKIPSLKSIESSAEYYCQKERDSLRVMNPDIIQFTKDQAVTVLAEYFKIYKEDFTKKKWMEVEKELSVYCKSHTRNLKVDGDFVDKKKNNWLLETKTKGRISEERLIKMLSFDFQNLFYLTSSEKYYGKRYKGVIYNLIRRPQIKQKKGERIDEYFQRLTNDIKERPEFYFMRFMIPYTLSDKVNFESEIESTIESLRRDIGLTRGEDSFIATEIFYKTEQACDSGYFTCEYLDACSSETLALYVRNKKIFVELDTVKY